MHLMWKNNQHLWQSPSMDYRLYLLKSLEWAKSLYEIETLRSAVNKLQGGYLSNPRVHTVEAQSSPRPLQKHHISTATQTVETVDSHSQVATQAASPLNQGL